MYLRFVEIEYKQADNMLWELLKILDAWGTSDEDTPTLPK
jgi:hypothetical protein